MACKLFPGITILSGDPWAIITESIYSVGGMGKMLPNAINQYNNVMIVALAFMFSTVSVQSVLAGDWLLTKVDPRISLSEKAGRS